MNLGLGLTYPAHGTVIERGSLRARQIILHHERLARSAAARNSSRVRGIEEASVSMCWQSSSSAARKLP